MLSPEENLVAAFSCTLKQNQLVYKIKKCIFMHKEQT